MTKITVVLDISEGTIDGFRDIKQVSGSLGISDHRMRGILSKGGIHIAGTKMIGSLNLKKSKRGGNRIKTK